MRNIFLCGHTGSINRGCEAIIRSTVEILNYDSNLIYLATFAPSQDLKLVNELKINLLPYKYYPTKLHRILCGAVRKLVKTSTAGQIRYIQTPLVKKLNSDDICLIVGGDTYCYRRPVSHIALNNYLYKHNIKNILWCCSIEKKAVTKEILKDLKKYSYIFAREQITYQTLLDVGISTDKLIKVCDPAFFLRTKKVPLPNGFLHGNTVGINVSPMVVNKSNPIVYESIINLIQTILDKTDMRICLIPHVYCIKDKLQDYDILIRIKNDICNNRLSIVTAEYTCEELKYIISQCRFFVGARTHATIAAYSSGVPTLVLGYSVKSKGIATDLFGKYEGYVIPYDEICNVNSISDAFFNIYNNEEKLRTHLNEIIPSYQTKLSDAITSYIV